MQATGHNPGTFDEPTGGKVFSFLLGRPLWSNMSLEWLATDLSPRGDGTLKVGTDTMERRPEAWGETAWIQPRVRSHDA